MLFNAFKAVVKLAESQQKNRSFKKAELCSQQGKPSLLLILLSAMDDTV